ncbi:basic proline-rich protein-like [Motacilla alba alba]|uniref:basic proline-rich protein-like n=1 Tax=Motacilla alba alba TaxID=1094192 RepID=UPI0018D510CA|nr:basic proline-rich protein-like [Motacilla alba alba]
MPRDPFGHLRAPAEALHPFALTVVEQVMGCREVGGEAGSPRPPVVPVRASAETRGRRQAGAGAVARHPGPHSPCPRWGPSPGPPLPRIASAPRRPPPPAAAAPGRGAGGGRRCPAGTDSRRCSRCRSRCVSGCGSGGVRRTRSAGHRRLHPAPVVAAGVKFQPLSPDRRGGHRHRDPDSHWHQDTNRRPDPHVVAPGLRPARAPGPHRDQEGTGIPPAAGAAAQPASAPALAVIRTASELPRKLAPRREQHRDPPEAPDTATATCPSADPRADGPAAWTDGRPDGHTDTLGKGFSPSRSASGAELRGGPLAHVGDPAGMGCRAGSGPSRQRRGRPVPQASRADSGHRCAWRSCPAAPEEESGLPPARAPRHGPPRLGRPPPGSLPLLPPCLPPPGPPLAPGTWGPAGEWSRARASPYVTARGPPRPSRGSRVLLANVPNPGAASARPRFTRAPLAGADRRDAPRARRAPRVRPAWLRGPRAPGRAARPAMLPAVSPAPAALRRLGATPRAYATPRLERGQRLGRRLCHGCTPRSPRPRATRVALTSFPPPGSPGPAVPRRGRMAAPAATCGAAASPALISSDYPARG